MRDRFLYGTYFAIMDPSSKMGGEHVDQRQIIRFLGGAG